MVVLYLIVPVVFCTFGILTSWLLRRNLPNEEKLSSYECGEEPSQSAVGQFNPRFFILALIFVLFEIEAVFLVPLFLIFKDTIISAPEIKWILFTEVWLFIFLLAMGLIYAWRKGFFDWERTLPEQKKSFQDIPLKAYENYLK